MNASELRKQIKEKKVILAIRGIYDEEFRKASEIFIKNGLSLIEVAFDQTDTDTLTKTTDNLRYLKSEYGNTIHIGAGTVITKAQVHAAKDAGAEFILSPEVQKPIIVYASQLDLPFVPGAMTPTEIQKAWDLRATAVKLFPAGDLGVNYIKSICSPLGHIPLIPMGRIDSSNVNAFLSLKNVIGVGISTAIADKTLILNHNWTDLEAKTKNIAKLILQTGGKNESE